MKKELTIAAITLLFAVTPVLAHNSHQEGDNHGNSQNSNEDDDRKTNLAVSPTSVNSCDPSDDWKNHGAFVSCVAHLHHDNDDNDNDNDVDDDARSDIGKKNNPTGTPTPTSSVTPTGTITPTPTVSLTPSESPTPTISVSPTPTTGVSPTSTVSATNAEFGGNVPVPDIKTLITKILNFLIHLL